MTELQKRFADRYFETLNGCQSAIYAGYSEPTARQKAYELLQDNEIEAYLAELRAKSEIKHNISLDRWLSELEAVGFSNVQSFISEGNTIKDISKLPEEKTKAVSSIKKTVIDSEMGTKETVEFKLHDKLSALEKIGKHFGYFEKDNAQLKPETNLPPIVNVYNTTPPLAGSEEDV